MLKIGEVWGKYRGKSCDFLRDNYGLELTRDRTAMKSGDLPDGSVRRIMETFRL